MTNITKRYELTGERLESFKYKTRFFDPSVEEDAKEIEVWRERYETLLPEYLALVILRQPRKGAGISNRRGEGERVSQLTITTRRRWTSPVPGVIDDAPTLEIVALNGDMHVHDVNAKVLATVHPDFSHLADDIADAINKPRFLKKVCA